MAFDLQFLGGAGTVTGSKYLLSHAGKKTLVDCGMFQGLKALRLKNWAPFPVDPAEIDAIILTHAHIDHSGYIPRLVKEGFRGRIYATQPTKDLCRILLPDTGYLLEEEAEYLNRHQRSKHAPALPLFSRAEAESVLKYFETVAFHEKKELAPNLSFEFRYAGHILGAASAVVTIAGRKITFTGDVGRFDDAIFYPPENLLPTDYLVTESTYGNRQHKKGDPMDELAKIINETYKRGGIILIPSFAVGRAQTLMYYLLQLKEQKRIPDFPMYLNSPMAVDVSQEFCEHHDLHRLSAEKCIQTCNVVKYVHSAEESKALNTRKGPMLIIAGSGMVTGGRILHHLKEFGTDPANTIVLTGYQAAGTRGEALEHGVEAVKIHGEYVTIKAQVRVLENMSAHADYGEMLQWFLQSKIRPRRVFITHGEASAADDFRRRVSETLQWDCVIPTQDERVTLD